MAEVKHAKMNSLHNDIWIASFAVGIARSFLVLIASLSLHFSFFLSFALGICR